MERGLGISPRYEYYPINIFGRWYWKRENNYTPKDHITYYEKHVSSKEQLKLIYNENFSKPYKKNAS